MRRRTDRRASDPRLLPERKEARSRLLQLLSREGRTRLAAEAEPLRERLLTHPEDREAALYLVELDLRLQDPARALETLPAFSPVES